MTSVNNEIEKQLNLLIGFPLSIARRAADMLILDFGTIREVNKINNISKRPNKRRTFGDFSLHIQCPWRLENTDRIITGRGDLYFSAQTGEYFDDLEDNDTYFEFGKNLQDKIIGELLQGFDPITHSYLNTTKSLVVEKVDADNVGGATIFLSGGYRILLFPSSSKGEDWRLFQGGSNEKHFVVSGSRFEFE
jgi:hypothetical protein